jgi:hypothetical protein
MPMRRGRLTLWTVGLFARPLRATALAREFESSVKAPRIRDLRT